MKTKNPLKKNKYEIFYHIINSLLAGLLVLLGSFASGQITINGIFIAVIASLIVCISQFKDYWNSESQEYKTLKVFNFIN